MVTIAAPWLIRSNPVFSAKIHLYGFFVVHRSKKIKLKILCVSLKVLSNVTYPASSYTLGSPLTQGLPSPSFHGVVVSVPAVVGVKELLEPLQELKVVLELGLHQLVNLDALKDFEGHQGEMLWCTQTWSTFSFLKAL